jgi:hypothetical protein
MGDGKPIGATIKRMPENARVIDYFYEKLKNGVNV